MYYCRSIGFPLVIYTWSIYLSLNFQLCRHMGHCWVNGCEFSHLTMQCMWKQCVQAPQTSGQSSPGNEHSVQQLSKGIRHIPQFSSLAIQRHVATPIQAGKQQQKIEKRYQIVNNRSIYEHIEIIAELCSCLRFSVVFPPARWTPPKINMEFCRTTRIWCGGQWPMYSLEMEVFRFTYSLSSLSLRHAV